MGPIAMPFGTEKLE